MSASDFDWQDSESIAVREQPATAVYTNPHGHIVVRQQGDYSGFEDDKWIMIQPANIPALVAALWREIGQEEPAPTQRLLEGPKDPTAAERQRRHRHRQRDRHTTARDRRDVTSVEDFFQTGQ